MKSTNLRTNDRDSITNPTNDRKAETNAHLGKEKGNTSTQTLNFQPDTLNTSPNTNGWIPKMVWKRWTPLDYGHFWYQFVRFLGCKSIFSFCNSPQVSCHQAASFVAPGHLEVMKTMFLPRWGQIWSTWRIFGSQKLDRWLVKSPPYGCFPKMVGFPPKSSILIGVSIIFTIHFGCFPPIFGNIHIAIWKPFGRGTRGRKLTIVMKTTY